MATESATNQADFCSSVTVCLDFTAHTHQDPGLKADTVTLKWHPTNLRGGGGGSVLETHAS